MNLPTITVQLTDDAEFIDALMAELLEDITDDQHTKPASADDIIVNPDCTCISIALDGMPTGLVIMVKNEIHTLFPKQLRGALALRAARIALQWIWDNLPYTELTSFAYSHRPEVLRFAHLAGFKTISVVDQGTTVKGVHVTRTNLALSKNQ